MRSSYLLSQRLRHASVLAGLLAAAVGGTALAGWLLGRPTLHTWFDLRGSLAAGAGLGLLLLGLGIATVAPEWKRPWKHRIALVPAAGTLALGLVALFEATVGVDLVLDERLAAGQVLAAGHMPALAAFELIVSAVALALLALGRRRQLVWAQILSLVALGVSGVGLTGHLYGLDALLLDVSPLPTVSLPGQIGLVAAALGLLGARPGVGVTTLVVDPTAGGASVRRLLPVTVVLVILLGALRVWGEERGYFPGPLGSALFAVGTVFLVGGLIVWNAVRLREAELSLRREQEIRDERQRQFRHAIVEAPIPILMFTDGGEVLQVSRTVEEVTGHPREDVPDLASWGRLLAGEESADEVSQRLLAAVEGFREMEVRTRTGEKRTWRIRTSSLGRLADDRNAYVTMATDLTEIRRAEEQKDDFLAVLGHELRNPLAALSTGLEVQRRHEDPERRGAILDMMRRQVSHLARLLDDLLDVSRISRGKIALHPEVLLLNEAVERVVEEHRDLLPKERGTRISLSMPTRPIAVPADPTRLHQILGNLLGNAVKYTPEGGRIWVTLERDREEAIVRIRDSGIGMEPHEIDSVFEPFRQLGHDDGRRRGGLGLGLTLVRQLASLHGGSVAAASRGRNRGSTFTLRLPLAAEELLPARRPTVEEEPPPDLHGAGALRILVVDDQRAVADGFAELLSLSGHEVAAAYGGEEALKLVDRHRPHVVFLDLDLPDLDGRTVARRIRARHEPPPLLVAVSGFGGERHFARSREAGIDRHLVKPVNVDQVLALLQEVSAGGEKL